VKSLRSPLTKRNPGLFAPHSLETLTEAYLGICKVGVEAASEVSLQ